MLYQGRPHLRPCHGLKARMRSKDGRSLDGDVVWGRVRHQMIVTETTWIWCSLCNDFYKKYEILPNFKLVVFSYHDLRIPGARSRPAMITVTVGSWAVVVVIGIRLRRQQLLKFNSWRSVDDRWKKPTKKFIKNTTSYNRCQFLRGGSREIELRSEDDACPPGVVDHRIYDCSFSAIDRGRWPWRLLVSWGSQPLLLLL